MVIGISGKKQSGKNTVANIINELLGNRYELKMFAEKVKEIVCIITGCTMKNLESEDFKNSLVGNEWGNLTYRDFLQKIGTDCGRNIIHPNIWVNTLMKDYKMQYASAGIGGFHDPRPSFKKIGFPRWIITDVRFPNEANAVRDKRGLLIRVNRKGIDISTHHSEMALDDYDDFDYIIDNDGTEEDLVEKVKEILIKEKLIKENK